MREYDVSSEKMVEDDVVVAMRKEDGRRMGDKKMPSLATFHGNSKQREHIHLNFILFEKFVLTPFIKDII